MRAVARAAKSATRGRKVAPGLIARRWLATGIDSPLRETQARTIFPRPFKTVARNSRPRFKCSNNGLHVSSRRLATSSSSGFQEPTIYALSTAPGRAAIAVIRISGPASLDIYRALCPGTQDPKSRYATVRTLYEPGKTPSQETILDSSALLLHFPAPATATGEDVLELHVHGGPAIVKAVLAAISKCGVKQAGTIRYAEPGEFTRRAFMNNRLDLTQVEALGDTLSADTEQQRRLSVRGTTGSLAKQYEKWRQMLLYARGELEALIDFSEDQHFDESPTELMSSVAEQVKFLQRALQIHSQNAVRGELLRHGISISLLGAPNAGKSSLLNRIVGREAAIVSNEAGTTRDVVEIGLDIGGYFCRFGDTAGLRQATKGSLDGRQTPEVINRIEQEGMRRAKERAADSDLVIVVISFERDGKSSRPILNLDPEVCTVAQQLIQEKGNVMLVINKSDLAREKEQEEDVSAATHAHAIQTCLENFPGLDKDDVHLLSCRDAASTAPGQHQSSSAALASTQSHSTHQQAQQDDRGGIQNFLRGLIRQFGKLTAALTPAQEDESYGTGTADAGGGGDAGLFASASRAAELPADLSMWQEYLGASERHRVLLDSCVSHLNAFLIEASPTGHASIATLSTARQHSGSAIQDIGLDGEGDVETEGPEPDIVVAAEHLRAAAECLAKITGKGEAGDVEEVLGVVFEKFCVGK